MEIYCSINEKFTGLGEYAGMTLDDSFFYCVSCDSTIHYLHDTKDKFWKHHKIIQEECDNEELENDRYVW